MFLSYSFFSGVYETYPHFFFIYACSYMCTLDCLAFYTIMYKQKCIIHKGRSMMSFSLVSQGPFCIWQHSLLEKLKSMLHTPCGQSLNKNQVMPYYISEPCVLYNDFDLEKVFHDKNSCREAKKDSAAKSTFIICSLIERIYCR